MSIFRFLGIILLVTAAVLLYFGYTSSQSFAQQVHGTFTGRFTDTVTWYFIAGVAASIGGMLLVTLRFQA